MELKTQLKIDQFTYRLKKQMFNIHKSIVIPNSISQSNIKFLLCLQKTESERGMTMTEISDNLSVDKALTTRAICNLEKKNLVFRDKTDKNMRNYKIMLTEKGRQVSNLILKQLKDATDTMFNKLTENEINTFMKIMEKMIEN